MANDLVLKQVVDFPTCENDTLDLFFTNRPSVVNQSETLPGISDHEIVYIDSCVMAKRRKPVKREIHLWKNTDFDQIRQEVDNFVTNFMDQHSNQSSVNEMWMEIKNCIQIILNEHVPSKFTTTTFNQPWITRKIKKLSKGNKKATSKAKTTKSSRDWDIYKRLKKRSSKEM